ncbi:nitrite/sulfite reductase [Rubrivivax gelatinosus]|uniref:Sulfite reductase (NADPH) hemoprotein beta-component n=1 Tax=Rubrivivax gelatinosus TaxID=28068 RepID=A0A4R2M035_RUBGE|nr:nitrite/sulfite reductase [Rubrivivax gelatinosus]MBK1687958.1 nitrite reductase [Rubrivivax gelatinosus]TCO99239.1 sulfite reductase (NADPH) hemoprotein beta-component [Rubrivivax gelatinosus]
MYQYTEFDRQFIRARAAQFRDQLERHLAGQLPDELFRPLRLQNGWYVQRHAPMARIAVPYGELSSRQLRALARVAREFDLQDAGTPNERGGFGHFTTRHNCQFNWIPLERSADVMELLAEADLHGVQTSGNCIRNVTTDALAGIAPDEIVDPRPYAELLRQWSTLHPEFAFLPRKFKVAITGATDDRAVIAWHDVGLQLLRDDAGEVGFRVLVGGGMGRTPVIATEVAAFVPWQRILVFLEAVVRVYNLHGRRDNLYKARIKILVKALGEQFIREVHAEYEALLADGAPELPQAELDRVAANFVAPVTEAAPPAHAVDADAPKAYTRWLERNVHAHRLAGYRAVTLSLKRAGQAPGDVTADQMDRAAELAERFSHGELRVTHDQNLLLPWVAESELRALWLAAREDGFATPNIGLLTDMIACPGGDLCSLANARSLPVAAAIFERFEDLDALYDLGDLDLHISGCMNSCGHHHTGHIGILGVDKDGSEWFQVTVAGSDGSQANGPAAAGKVIGPSFAADEVPDVVEALVELYRAERQAGERFVDTVRRLGVAPLRAAADAVRRSTAAAEA